MTCNQLVVLLDVYRGTFSPGRHLGTVDGDLKTLMVMGLVKSDHELTLRGIGAVHRILEFSKNNR